MGSGAHALVLNATYEPLCVVPTRRALVLVLRQKAVSLEDSERVVHSARLDVGVGVLVFSGLDKQGNPFTMNGTAATGALSTFHTRVAVSADYAVTPNVVVTATPIAFAYSPAPSGFDPSISSLTTLSFLVGVGYRR